MIITPRLRKGMLTTHITFSVGWLGAVAVFLALAIAGLTSKDTELACSSYLAMELSAWFVIVPFCLASLFTGIVQAAGTKWGLFKHYWIVVKLFLTIASTILLLLHLKPINHLANAAAVPSFSDAQQTEQLIDLIKKAGAAILVLLVITTISVYKPWGKIQWAQNSNGKYIKVQIKETKTKKSWALYTLIALAVIVLAFILIHLLGGSMRGH